MSVRTVGVSVTVPATSATSQVSRPSTAARAKDRRSCGSRRLPEPRLVLVEQPQAAHPLRALPEVQMRNEQPRGPAVLGIERLAVVRERHPCLPSGQILDGDVRRVTAVAKRDRVSAIVFDALEQGVDRDTFPVGVELRPLRDAVNVLRHRFGGECAKLLPGPADGPRPTLDRESPLLERRVRRGPRREHRKIVSRVLPRRQPPTVVPPPPPGKPTRNNPHTNQSLTSAKAGA